MQIITTKQTQLFRDPTISSETDTRLPNTPPTNTHSSTPYQPTNAPTNSIIFMSPPPIASSFKTQPPTKPTAYSSAKPVAAPSTPSMKPGTPAVRDRPSPRTSPVQLYSSGMR